MDHNLQILLTVRSIFKLHGYVIHMMCFTDQSVVSRFKLSAQKCPDGQQGLSWITHTYLFQEEVKFYLQLRISFLLLSAVASKKNCAIFCCRPTDTEGRILKIKSNGFIVFVPKYDLLLWFFWHGHAFSQLYWLPVSNMRF